MLRFFIYKIVLKICCISYLCLFFHSLSPLSLFPLFLFLFPFFPFLSSSLSFNLALCLPLAFFPFPLIHNVKNVDFCFWFVLFIVVHLLLGISSLHLSVLFFWLDWYFAILIYSLLFSLLLSPFYLTWCLLPPSYIWGLCTCLFIKNDFHQSDISVPVKALHLKAHCPTCSYLLPLYRKLPKSVPVGPPMILFFLC